ncbi:MAG: NAD(P)/FAD-dependent oxidoreductase [Solobacterium sp.]|jgi:glycerol-3-phosphate dehydrogenase|nr:NAD(P)/FAD-dependent oxidoreductase [Solobacterium sp.]MCH4205942.1 NAD(P)/FAD-dependent oxidoreductase [Solobacterium sp.]MCH4226225.1 NAD(P)/FAD-dependent oxidoreductase [Solobacterium sp.]MCH4282730.1 NAD(P)/FAD-dependent oxidoreductase [Solobacterium sp.]
MYDAVIIGAGITGTMIARDLSQYQLKIALIDKENDIADGATMANSAIVHTGYDPEDNTMKAKMNVRGARMYPQLCRDLGCRYTVVGAYIAACGKEEEEHLDVLKERAERREIPYAFLSGDEARKEEPNLNEQVTKVISFPTTAVIYPWEAAIACAQVAVNNGTELVLNAPVKSIEHHAGMYTVHTDKKDFETKIVINAAGVCADQIYRMVSEHPNFSMKPRKGEYYVIDNAVHYVKHVVFPVPSAKGKGVLAVPTVYGNTLIGPNSDYVPSTTDTGSTFQGLDYVKENASKIMKNVPLNRSIRNFAGLRPSSSSSDFIIEEAKDAENFINVASIESPGLASAPAIAEYVVQDLLKGKLDLKINEQAVMTRQRPLVMSELTPAEREAKIKENPMYGRIICRCEQISEGEIVDCIHAVCGARSVKGVKKRVRPGMGRCQGGFCEPRVVAILARELHESELDVVLDSQGSKILAKENR